MRPSRRGPGSGPCEPDSLRTAQRLRTQEEPGGRGVVLVTGTGACDVGGAWWERDRGRRQVAKGRGSGWMG